MSVPYYVTGEDDFMCRQRQGHAGLRAFYPRFFYKNPGYQRVQNHCRDGTGSGVLSRWPVKVGELSGRWLRRGFGHLLAPIRQGKERV